MSTVGSNNRGFEDAYKKLARQLESVYASVKSKADFDSVETKKEEFMKLFCRAFESNPEYGEDDDGLQFVHGKDEDDEDDGDLVCLDDEVEEVKPTDTAEKKNQGKKNKNSSTSQEDNDLIQDKKPKHQEKDKNVFEEVKPSGDITAKESNENEMNKSKKIPEVISVEVPSELDKNPREQQALTPRGLLRLEHGSFSNKRTNSYFGENGTTTNKNQTTKESENHNENDDNVDNTGKAALPLKEIVEVTNPGLNHNLSSEQSDTPNATISSEDITRSDITPDEKTEIGTASTDGLPSLSALGNASEVAKLLSGDSLVARRFALIGKGNGHDWAPQYSNQSWTSMSSASSASHDLDLMGNTYMDLNANGAQDTLFNGISSNANVQLQVVRQVLRNLILLLLAQHPNGVYDTQLQEKYEAMMKIPLQMDDNIEYLLFNHRNVLITPCANQSNLLTLNHQAVQSMLEEYSTQEIADIVSGHINAIIKLFPDGISSNILDEMVSNFRGYKLSQVITDPHQFVMDKCDVVVNTDEGTPIYFPASSNVDMKSNLHNYSRVLSSAIGYRELLIALLANHKKPINIEELETEFEELFHMPLNACSPVINRILKKINDPALNQEQKQSQLEHALHVLDQANTSRGSLRSSLRSSYNSLKSMVSKFRLAANFELHYEKNRALFELFCPKVRQDSTVIKSPFKEDHRMVFMGGFAHGTSIKELEDALAKYGVKVIDCKGISYRNYGWSFVKVETPEQAEQLAAYSPIQIRGRNIDVRPFIDRKRVKNHQQNRPSTNDLLEAVLEAVHQTPSGLTVAQIQTNLFHKFQFRVDGTEITKLVSKNAKLLQIKRHPIERIIPTPKMHRLSMEELKSKILKIWTDSDNLHDSSDKKKGTLDSGEKIKEQKVLSLADFENEFARRYKAFLEPRLYGYHSVHELLQSMSDILCFPQVHLQSRVPQQQGELIIDQPPVARLANINEGTNGNTNNNENSMMFNNNGVRTMTSGINPNSMTNRSTILPTSSATVGLDQINSTMSSMHASNPLLANRGIPMQTITCMPMQSSYQPMSFMSNSGFPMTMTSMPPLAPMSIYPGSVLPQMSDADMALPTLENFLSLQSIPTEQQQMFLPSLSNLGAFSNRSLGSQSPGASKQNNMKPATNQSALPLFNQLSNGSQFITPTKHMG